MRVVVSFVGGWGHVEPLLPIASLASDLGHQLSFAGQEAVAGRLQHLGHRVDVVGPDTLRSTTSPLVPVDRERERTVLRDHFVGDFGHRRADTLATLFEREHPDLVICDEVDVGAVVAAERRGVPCITVNVIAAGRLASPTVVESAWNALRRRNGLVADAGCERMGGSLAIASVPTSFRDPAEPVPMTMRFTRPSILDQLTGPGPRRRPIVYVSLGTVFNLESGDLLGRLIEGMNRLTETEDVDVLITIGPHISLSELPAPDPQVKLSEFVPLREVLGGCGAVVCHGGSGTVVAALSLGIPLVVLPMGADQPDNADRCHDLGVGVVLDPLTASPNEISEATEAALLDPVLRSNARALRREAMDQTPLADLPELRRLLAG